MVADHRVNTRYYFGKYTLACAKIIKGDFLYISQNVFKIGDTIEIRKKRYKRQNDEVDLFLNILINSGIELSDVQLIVFDADPFNNSFVKSLKENISSSNYPMFIRNMVVLDASQLLKRDHILLLDGHYNKLGHQVVANMILRHINP